MIVKEAGRFLVIRTNLNCPDINYEMAILYLLKYDFGLLTDLTNYSISKAEDVKIQEMYSDT